MTLVSPPVSARAVPASGKTIFQIVGLVCLAGFTIDMLVRLLPLNPGNVQWRSSILQQLADRNIVFLLGVGLMLFSLESRRWLKRLSLVSLVMGVLFLLASLFIIRDSLTLQHQAIANINNQVSQVQTQIQAAQTTPNPQLKLTPEQLEQAAKTVDTQATAVKETAKTTLMKTGIASFGNLVVGGLGLIGLGRYGLRSRQSRSYSDLVSKESQV